MAGNQNSGRPKMEEELLKYKESVKRQTIEDLATEKVFNHIKTIDDTKDRQGVKDIAMPVYLKSKADKVKHSGEVGVTGFNFLNNATNDKTNKETGASVEEDMGQED